MKMQITAKDNKITSVRMVSKKITKSHAHPPVAKKTDRQLAEYFKGRRKKFSIRLEPAGTDFQKKVWKELLKIPYGKTVSYGQIAKAIGHPKAVRAVASAVGANPFCILIPCHRVIAGDGSLGGYAFGLAKKSELLKREGVLR